jgi:hypothetical protein
MCTVLLPPGGNPIAVNKYIISYTNCGAFAKYLYLLGYPKSLTPFHSKTALLWRQNVGNNETCLGLHVMCPVFLSYFNIIYGFLANLNSPHNQISPKSFKWDPRWCMRTDRKTWRSEKVIFEKMRQRLQWKTLQYILLYMAQNVVTV